MGMVFQNPAASLNPLLRVREQIELPLKLHYDLPAQDRAERVANMAAKVGLPADVLDRFPHQLSGGQQQRVLLARALCATSKLLLLDEPVTGLDPLATAELYAIIKALNREQGITILMVSHDVSCALHDATMVLHLSDKGMAFFGTAQAYHLSPISQPFLRCDCVGHHNSHVCDASCGGNVP